MNTTVSIGVDWKNLENSVYTYLSLMKYILIFTIPLYIQAFYCLIWKSSTIQKHCVLLFLAHVCLSMLEEVYGLQLLCPFTFPPIIGIYADGLLSMMGVHVFIQIIGVFIIFQVNSAVLIHMTLFRLKVIIPMTFKYYDEVIELGKLVMALIYICCVFAVFIFYFLYEDQNEAKNFIQKTSKPLPNLFWSEKYIVSTGTHIGFPLFFIVCAISVSFYTSVCSLVPVFSWYILYKTRHSLSAKVVNAQKSYLITLLLQVLVMVSFVSLPFVMFFAVLKYNIDSPALTAASIIFTFLNGSASIVILLIGIKPYRQALKQQFNLVFFTARIVKAKKYAPSANAIHDTPL